MPAYALPFDSEEVTLATVGGKGISLSRMSRAGFPIPPGLFITTDAYCAFVGANHLQQQIIDMANNEADTSEAKSETIRQLFARGKIPVEIAKAIHSSFADLMQIAGDLPLAVRSSATAEDLPGASFAGQQESYLNVRGEQAVLDTIKRCWSSLWTPQALEYRARQHIDPADVSLAVVVQIMVRAEVAGIMFTANPLNGSSDEIVLDAAWGLGEAIVGGLTTPDHFVIDKASETIKQMVIGDKSIMTVCTATGTEEREVETNRRSAPTLNADQVSELVKLGAAIESFYGVPQDIEWCFANDKFYIVQARPITALPEPLNWESPIPGAKWIKDMQAGEWATEPLSPLGATTTFDAMINIRQRKLPMQKSPWSALINGWLYIRADYRSLWWTGLIANMVRFNLTGTFNGHRRMQRLWPPQLTSLTGLEKIELAKLSDQDLRAYVDQLLQTLAWWWWEVSWYTAVTLHVPLLSHLPDILFRGNDSLLLEGERALRIAANTGDADTYLAKFGHLVESADPIHPTLRESPDLLKQHMIVAQRSKITPEKRLMNLHCERREAENQVRSLPGFRGALKRWALKLGQSYTAHTDDAVFHFQRVLALLRYSFLEVGRRMVKIGVLKKAEDAFYLERRELWHTGSDLQDLVTQRRNLREHQKRLVPPPLVPSLSNPAWENDQMWKRMSAMFGETVLKRGVQEQNGRKVIVGIASSPGRARGIARVITGPDEFCRFQPGEILVAHATTPVWTPLFNIASGAVTEVGGPFCHAAIVAREFSIPLVDGALDAMQEISDGMPVIVDGSAGIVYLEEYSSKENHHVHAHLGLER